MGGSRGSRRLVLAVVGALLAAPAPTSAQLGRINGTVRDENGRPLKGATVVAENPDATPASFTAITNDKGQFSMIGLRSGAWRFTAAAPGFIASSGAGRIQTIGANPPIEFRLARSAAPGAGGLLAGVDASDVQASIARADAAMTEGKYDEALAGYRQALAKAPALTTLNLQIGRALRMMREYDGAIARYRQLIDANESREPATVELGMTFLEKGDVGQADAILTEAAQSAWAGKDVFFSLGEVKFARNQADEAVHFYQKAADADPAWAKPLLKLGLVAVNRGDREAATRYLERVLALDPASGEAAQARAILEHLRK